MRCSYAVKNNIALMASGSEEGSLPGWGLGPARYLKAYLTGMM